MASILAIGLARSCASGRSEAAVVDAGGQVSMLRSGSELSLIDSRWQAAGEHALAEPLRVTLPHARKDALLAHQAAALGLAFEATRGQILEIGLAREVVADAAYDDGSVYVDLFRVSAAKHGIDYLPVDGISIDGAFWHARITETGDYVIRIQPAPLVSALLRLTIELAPALPFPVDGYGEVAVQSFFGDSRDQGSRAHEGIDIFAARSTPVLAVARGRAVPRRNKLGGNVVWLNTSGVSYYYAHLEHSNLEGPRSVAVGDVIGYVGNSGNAASTDPHLHFAMYRWGRGPIDPMPLLRDLRFPTEDPLDVESVALSTDATHQVVTDTSRMTPQSPIEPGVLSGWPERYESRALGAGSLGAGTDPSRVPDREYAARYRPGFQPRPTAPPLRIAHAQLDWPSNDKTIAPYGTDRDRRR